MDSFGAKRSQLTGRDRPGPAIRRGRLGRPPHRPEEPVRRLVAEEEKAAVNLPDIPEMPERERLAAEKEVLGFYLSSHPLAEYEAKLSQVCSHTTADIADLPDRAEVILGGMLSAIKFAHVKKLRPGATATKYANFDLEDKDGAIRCILWPEDFAKFGEFVQPDAVVVAPRRHRPPRRRRGQPDRQRVDPL